MKLYLLSYNLICLALWSQILAVVIISLSDVYSQTVSIQHVWDRVSGTLLLVQTAALLEVIHPILGLTRTPVSSAAMQVGSRLMVLWGYSYVNKEAQNHYSFILMAFSWALVEVFRYSFYCFVCAEVPVPYILFQLRYSLFAVLYPTGISGELGQMIVSLPHMTPILARLSHIYIFLYIPFGPYMILNMYNMRKRAFKKRNAANLPKRKPDGLVWPLTDKEKNVRSTSITNKKIWQKSIVNVDDKMAAKIGKVRNWRFGYVKYVEQNVRACLLSRTAALKVAEQGLKAARDEFVFVRDDKEYKPTAAMSTFKDSFHTGFIEGNKETEANKNYVIPYKSEQLSGETAIKALEQWVAEGTIERSAADSIINVVKQPEWTDLSDMFFVLLGATSAMGPLNDLLSLGANIIAIDLDRPQIWKNLIEKARNSSGTLTFPLSKPQADIANDDELYSCAGANLLSKTPEIANWLKTVVPEEDLTIGNYTYLDGALHVQLSLACDMIIEEVSAARDTAVNIAFLCTPTDVHCIPAAAAAAAKENWKTAPAWQKLLEGFKVKDLLVKNFLKPVETKDDGEVFIVDGITSAQGPNYALAKRMQHWRSVIAHQNGQVVSANIAPSTATKSVVSNASFAAAYGGMHKFKCMEVFYQETSSAVMLALLINDLRNPESASHLGGFQKAGLVNPFRLFEMNSFNGGVWRCPYKLGTIGIPSALYYYLNLPSVKIFVVAGVAVVYGTVNYVVHGHPV